MNNGTIHTIYNHRKKLSTKARVTKQDVKTSLLRTHKDAMKYYVCGGRGHRPVECPSKASTSRNEPFGHGPRFYCFKCGAMIHEAHECKTALQRSQPGSRAGGRGPGGNPNQAQRVACAMRVPRRSDEREDGLRMETLELKSEEMIKVLNGACMAEIKDNLPVLSGKVGGKKVEVLRDTGCSGVIIRRELVDETDFTGEMGHIMTVDRTIKRAPKAKVEVDTSFYVETVEALCLHDPLFDLIIGNVPGAGRSDDPNPEWVVVTAVATRAQARIGKNPKPLNMKKVRDKTSINNKDLIKMQEEDPTLQKLKQLNGTETRKVYVVSNEKRIGIWYRIRQGKDDVGDPRKQILVPKSLREKVMGVAHDSLFGEHLGAKKTEDRIHTNFFWPGLHEDVTSFCRSCDVCQKTVARGSVPRAPLGDMPLINQPFKRVAIDLVGPIAPASDKGHIYILILVDYATRYPEAVPLKNIDTDTVAEALLDMYDRVGVPEEVLSYLGTSLHWTA